jgi:hypothetical protein
MSLGLCLGLCLGLGLGLGVGLGLGLICENCCMTDNHDTSPNLEHIAILIISMEHLQDLQEKIEEARQRSHRPGSEIALTKICSLLREVESELSNLLHGGDTE